jgi:hypothetical protein
MQVQHIQQLLPALFTQAGCVILLNLGVLFGTTFIFSAYAGVYKQQYADYYAPTQGTPYGVGKKFHCDISSFLVWLDPELKFTKISDLRIQSQINQ